MKLCDVIRNSYGKYNEFLQKYISHILFLAMRIFVGLVFLKSGLTKFSNIDSAILLFEYEYNLPFLNPVFATYSSMFFEILCGFCLIFGIFSRILALPLIAMTLIIQFFVFQNIEHFYWLFLLSTIAIYGSGKISIDAIICKFCKK